MFVGNVQLVRGGPESVDAIRSLLAKEGLNTEGNPDVEVRTYGQFTVEDARLLCERAATKSITGSRRVFIVVAANMFYEAQNTMLKTLEEPAGNALFFFVVPAPEALLPTVRSRAQILKLEEFDVEGLVDAKAFLAATPQKRLDMLKPLLDKGEDDVRDLSSIIMFLSSLERILSKSVASSREGIDSIYRARKYATDKGSMLKSLLEQVALLTPMLRN